MIEVERIEEWRGRDVFDSAGEKLGKLDEVFFVDGTNDAAFARVKSGLLGRKTRVVPLAGAKVSRDHVRVDWTAEQVTGAPETAGGDLDGESARGLASHFGLQPAGADLTFETATARGMREEREAAEAERARELEAAAAERETEAQEAERTRMEAGQQAQAASEAAEAARRAAQEARPSGPSGPPGSSG
jgi:hypothetical protein